MIHYIDRIKTNGKKIMESTLKIFNMSRVSSLEKPDQSRLEMNIKWHIIKDKNYFKKTLFYN